MFGAYYFGQSGFGVVQSQTTTGNTCGGQTFGTFYFGKRPSCSDEVSPEPEPTPVKVYGGGPPPHYQERQEHRYEMSDVEDTMESVDMIMAWLAQQ